MLVSMQELMQDASKRNYAVASFATPTTEYINAAIQAAEELGAPVIIGVSELLANTGCDFEFMTGIMLQQAKLARVPVALHLDHAITPEFAMKGITLGYNSVHYDVASLPFEENASQVRAFADWAHKAGVAVEGEIGAMPSNVVGHCGCEEYGKEIDPTPYFTKPEEVQKYVEQSGSDLLTVSFGTIHGMYVKHPVLDIARLAKINAATDCPLVMHGSSGTPDDQVKQAIANGINKINYYSYMSIPIAQKLAEKILHYDVQPYFLHQVHAMEQQMIYDIALDRIKFFSNGVKF